MRPGGAADPHHDVPVAEAGAPLRRAKAVVVMLHGRGADAGDMLSLAEVFAQPDLAYLAPQAAGRSWYPYSFLAPIARNEPFLSSALEMLDRVLGRLGAESYQPGRVVLLGFSQGACLALEYAARRALRYGGLIGLSGGLIGPEGTPRDYVGHLAGTPVFLGCSDVDPHIPVDRVHETARVLGALGGVVTKRIYPGMGHVINDDEIMRPEACWRGSQTVMSRPVRTRLRRDGRHSHIAGMVHQQAQSSPSDWPELSLSDWADTCATLQLWTQVVGKIRLAHAPMVNHWWQVPLYVTCRGLTTSPIPYGGTSFQIDFDFVDHTLKLQTSRGEIEAIVLGPRTVADFYTEIMGRLRGLGLETRIWHPGRDTRRNSIRAGQNARLLRPGIRHTLRQGEPRAFLLGQLRHGGHPLLRSRSAPFVG